MLTISRKYNPNATLDNIEVPSQFIWGEYDEITPLEPWITMSNTQNIPLDVISGCGHSPMLENALEFTKALTQFHATLLYN